MTISDHIRKAVFEAVKQVAPDVRLDEIKLEHPAAEEHGDYSTNIALKLAKRLGKNPQEVAEKIISGQALPAEAKAQAGFINFWLSKEWLVGNLDHEEWKNKRLESKRIMVEFAHPNTHKQFHIGHLRNITIGESIIRLLEASGAKVFRTNYQGDVGMHVAKALYGVKVLGDEYLRAKKADTRGRVAFLGKAYVLGTKVFEEDEQAKRQIIDLNKKIYEKNTEIIDLWTETRQWSLDYFQLVYDRVYTRFDRLYFESEVADRGRELVLQNVGKVFEKSDGAIIFPGGKFGLHNRVFVNSEGNPTYEGKDMGLGELQFKEFSPDLIIHNLGPEQWDYTRVMFEALAQLFPETRGREMHLTYGWVRLKEGKMSSRTGNVVLGEWLLDEIKKSLEEKYPDRVSDAEPIAVAAAKYSLLKVSSNQEIAFSIDESISLEGDSGPYLQYTYARARSVLRKFQETNSKIQISSKTQIPKDLKSEEIAVLRYLYRFPEVVEQAAKTYSPNLVCSYLFELAKRFNNFYNNVPILSPSLRSSSASRRTAGLNNVPILKSDSEAFRLRLTEATAQVLKNGLNLLGIEALERM